jgi:hypothetical protein
MPHSWTSCAQSTGWCFLQEGFCPEAGAALGSVGNRILIAGSYLSICLSVCLFLCPWEQSWGGANDLSQDLWLLPCPGRPRPVRRSRKPHWSEVGAGETGQEREWGGLGSPSHCWVPLELWGTAGVWRNTSFSLGSVA